MNADFKKILHSFLPSFFLPSSLPLSCPLSFLPSFFFSCFCYYFKYTELHCSHFSLLALLLFPFLLFFSPYFFAFPSPPFLFSSPEEPPSFTLPLGSRDLVSCLCRVRKVVAGQAASLIFFLEPELVIRAGSLHPVLRDAASPSLFFFFP